MTDQPGYEELRDALQDIVDNHHSDLENGWNRCLATGRIYCAWCGRDYDGYFTDDGACHNDDCLGHRARLALQKAKGE